MTDTVDEELERAVSDFEMSVGDFLEDPAANEVKLNRARSRLTALFASRTLLAAEARHIAFECTEAHDCDSCATCLRLYHKLRRISNGN